MDDRPAGSQPPQNQPPPQQGYQPSPQQSYQQPPPQHQPQHQPQRQGSGMANMANMGAGNQFLMNPDVKLNSIERMTVMLIRLAAWVALLLLVITLCGDLISIFTGTVTIPGLGTGSVSLTFNAVLVGFINLLKDFATGALAAVTLLGLASIVESLIMIRQNRS